MSHAIPQYPLVIIGAGAAGLGASEAAHAHHIEHIVLEAAHRIGGRGLTEYLEPSIAVDLGCHWLHSATVNPYVQWARRLGFHVTTEPPRTAMYFDGEWLSPTAKRHYQTFHADCYRKMGALYRRTPAAGAIDAIDLSNQWAGYFCYWLSWLHSNDADAISVQDVIEQTDTGLDWPVHEGYGALLAQQGRTCPVRLNCAVEKIAWDGAIVRLTTKQGLITAARVIISVSMGVLAAEQIEFQPKLPLGLREAIHALPLGNSNYQFFSVAPNTFADDVPEKVDYQREDGCTAVYIPRLPTPYVFASTGGRFAWWLERQGLAAAEAWLSEALIDIFGSAIRASLRQFKASAWGFDPYIRGAYSSQRPGQRDQRARLRQPVAERLYFAGEATSPTFMNTAHGAYLSGQQTVATIVARTADAS